MLDFTPPFRLLFFFYVYGEVTEWSKVRHWKCRVLQKGTGGSNPSLSAILRSAPKRLELRMVSDLLHK